VPPRLAGKAVGEPHPCHGATPRRAVSGGLVPARSEENGAAKGSRTLRDLSAARPLPPRRGERIFSPSVRGV